MTYTIKGNSDIHHSFFHSISLIIQIPTIVHYSKLWLLKLVSFIGTMIWFISLLSVVLGLIFPYSARDPIAPKRLFIQQSQITFHHDDASSYSGLLIHPLDNLLIDPIIVAASPYFDKVEELPCVGIYCGMPNYYPVANMLKLVNY